MQQSQSQNLVQQIQEAFQKALETKIFDAVISTEWKGTALKSLLNTTPKNVGVSAIKFKELAGKVSTCSKVELSLFDFAVLNNNLEMTSPRDLGMLLGEYHVLIAEVESLTKQWNEVVSELRTEVQQQFATKPKAEA